MTMKKSSWSNPILFIYSTDSKIRAQTRKLFSMQNNSLGYFCLFDDSFKK